SHTELTPLTDSYERLSATGNSPEQFRLSLAVLPQEPYRGTLIRLVLDLVRAINTTFTRAHRCFRTNSAPPMAQCGLTLVSFSPRLLARLLLAAPATSCMARVSAASALRSRRASTSSRAMRTMNWSSEQRPSTSSTTPTGTILT